MGDGRRKRKKTGYHPQPSFFLFFSPFPSPCSFTDDPVLLLAPACLVFFLCLPAQSLLHTSSWRSLQPVSTGPPPPPGKRRKLFCGHLIAAVRRPSVGVSAPLLSHRRHLYTHTHTHTPIGRYTWAEFEGGKELCGPLCRSPVASFHGVGETGGKVVCCFVLHWTKKLVYFVFHVQPCLVPSPNPFPQSPTLSGLACFLPSGRRT